MCAGAFRRFPARRQGFSLVELSIVLVILGLLTGGILAGQSLIHSAEMRSIITDYQRYAMASSAFRDKYMALPGDLPDATSFWGAASVSGCTNRTGTSATSPGVCDGDGDGIIGESGAASAPSEQFQFWRHLALAGLIEGDYSGIAGSERATDHDRGKNCPAGRIANTLWGSTYLDYSSGSTANRFARDFRNALIFGGDDDNARADGAALVSQDIWSIDVKLDDGLAGSGFVVCGMPGSCVDAAYSNTDLNAPYDMTKTIKTWMFFMPR